MQLCLFAASACGADQRVTLKVVVCRECAKTKLSDSEPAGSMACEACGIPVKQEALHCASALRATLKVPLPPHLQPAADAGQGGGNGGGPSIAAAAVDMGQSSKLKVLNEVRVQPPAACMCVLLAACSWSWRA